MAAVSRYVLLVTAVILSCIIVHGEECSDQGLDQCPGEGDPACYILCDGHPECEDAWDEANCTVTKQLLPGKSSSRSANLAWLITPCLLLVGLAYLLYKCVKDGVCRAIRRRITHGWRANHENRASDYYPLHSVNFFTSTQIPCNQPEGGLTTSQDGQQFMVVHNQSFSIQFRGTPPEGVEQFTVNGATGMMPPSYDEATKVAAANGGSVVMLKDGNMMWTPGPTGCQNPPPYPGSGVHGAPTRARPNAPGTCRMDRIEEVEEIESVQENPEDDDMLGDDDDEETVFLPKPGETNGPGAGRRRHHSQWSNKRRAENRRRHHSCPS